MTSVDQAVKDERDRQLKSEAMVRGFKDTIQKAVKRMCDEIFRNSQYAKTFGPVDDEFTYPYITYFNEKGDALRINHITERITFFPSGLQTATVLELRDLLYALEGAALSILVATYDEGIGSSNKVEIEGDNLLELFTNLLARHQDTSTKEHFQTELRRLNGGK